MAAESSSSKTLIFVKFTDTALRLLEAARDSSQLAIRFKAGNQGELSLPAGDGQTRSFDFSLASVDADGPQGSFECIRHGRPTGRSNSSTIDVLGKMDWKLQVAAGEDSYQKTKARMTVASEESKKHATKLLSQSDRSVGRKIKKKVVTSSNATSATHFSHHRKQTSGFREASSAPASGPVTTQPPLSMPSGFSSITRTPAPDRIEPVARHSSPPAIKLNGKELSSSASSSVPTSDSRVGAARGAGPPASGNPEIFRRPLKERIVHLLALRPYKKPELIAKLNQDGIKHKDKKGLSAMVASMSSIRENTHHIARHAWLDVQIEDWPFYTPEEREKVRKRYALVMAATPGNGVAGSASVPAASSNLLNISTTAHNHHIGGGRDHHALSPMSSDCSSLQASPSPPAPSPPDLSSGVKRRAAEILAAQAKKSRVSHVSGTRSKSPVPDAGRPQTNGFRERDRSGWGGKPRSPAVSEGNSSRPASATRELMSNGKENNSHWSVGMEDSRSPDEPMPQAARSRVKPDKESAMPQSSKKSSKAHANENDSPAPSSMSKQPSNSTANSTSSSQQSSGANHHSEQGPARARHSLQNGNAPPATSGASSAPNHNQLVGGHSHNGHGAVGSVCSSASPDSSPDSGTGSNDGSLSAASSRSYFSSYHGDHQAELVQKYREIMDDEGRQKLKNEFSRDYQEYLKLHRIVEEVARRFEELERRLRNFTEGSEEWTRAMEQIMAEYETQKKNSKYVDAKKRLLYLHEKLQHLKTLVMDYDRHHVPISAAQGVVNGHRKAARQPWDMDVCN